MIPRALAGDEALIEELTRRGASVETPSAYETVLDGSDADEIRARLEGGTIDVVTFTSSSTVKNFVAALGGYLLPASVRIACIGPTTAATVQELLVRPADVVATEHTVDGLIEALEDDYAGEEISS